MITYRQPFTGDYPISQKYGETITDPKGHTGIDYACPVNTPILASADGIVMKAGWDTTGYGNCVIILHTKDRATLYAHLSECNVYDNQKVKQGDVIGWSGYTGNVVPAGIQGAHLHFEARERWNDIKTAFDPMDLPLMTYVDSPNTERILKDADQFTEGDIVEITAPSGAKAFYNGFGDHTVYGKGARFYYTGQTKDRNGYTYMQVIAPVWIAVHDNDCQILDKAGK
jgi:murein DD-endopeptidase MepM/ murein hydrolase activator NlpD